MEIKIGYFSKLTNRPRYLKYTHLKSTVNLTVLSFFNGFEVGLQTNPLWFDQEFIIIGHRFYIIQQKLIRK